MFYIAPASNLAEQDSLRGNEAYAKRSWYVIDSRLVTTENSARAGAFAGLTGALAMSAWFFVSRLIFGIPTPSEMFADASAPLIPVHLFGLLIGFAHGYTPLKIFGFASVVAGQLFVGALGGFLFVARAQRSPRFLATFACGAWLVTAAVFWSVLLGNYRGRPASSAIVLTLASLAAGFALFGVVTWWCARAPAADSPERPDRTRTSRATWIAGALTALVAAAGWQRLFARATFSYDGRVEIGPKVVKLTPNERFYCVTKNFADPNVDASAWRLTVTGAVERPMTLDLAALTALPFVDQETTLMCINNDPGGGLMSNAIWRGVTLRALVSAAGPREGIVRAVLHAVDNYADTISFDKAMEPTTLVAYHMNGVSLPARHGFPVRMIVPGLFGEKSVKWLRSIELVTAPVRGFYERQGWGPNFRIPTHSRFDAPDFTQPVRLGAPIELRGVAFCGDRGVARVEVSDDDGHSWHDATFASHYAPLVWRLWRYAWRPARPGIYRLTVRATDAHGNAQNATDRSAETEGATGYHRVVAHVV